MAQHFRHIALAALLGVAGPSAADVIEDFSGDPAARWAFFTDQVMGGVSTGGVRVTTAGLRLTGTVSTANNGGFIQARRKPIALPATARAIRLKLRGNGAKYYVHLRTGGTVLPWQFYQAGFDTTGREQEVDLPLSAFTPEGGMLRASLKPTSVTSIAIVAYGADYAADITVTEIAFD